MTAFRRWPISDARLLSITLDATITSQHLVPQKRSITDTIQLHQNPNRSIWDNITPYPKQQPSVHSGHNFSLCNMSAAAGGGPPPPGGNGNEPWKTPKGKGRSELPQGVPWAPEDNEHNEWDINVKIKTCKCSICGERVKKESYSIQCKNCYFHICKQCAEPDGESGPMHKANAYFQLTDRCKCTYGGNRVPAFSRWINKHPEEIQGPPKRFEEDRRMREIKARTKEKQLKQQAEAEAKAEKHAASGQSFELQDDPFVGPNVSHPTIASNKRDCRGERKDYRDPETPSDSDNLEEPLKKQPRRGTTSGHTEGFRQRETSPFELGDQDVQEDFATFNESKKSAKSAAPVQHLRGGTTIVFGAGIVGLCIARELAAVMNETNTEHNIIVVDIRESFCCLASRECSGLLTIQGGKKEFNGLAALSLSCWQETLSPLGPDTLAELTGFQTIDTYKVKKSAGDVHQHKPSWYTGHKKEVFTRDPQTSGKL